MPPRRRILLEKNDGKRARSKSVESSVPGSPKAGPSEGTARVFDFALDSPTKPVKPKCRRISELTPKRGSTTRFSAAEALDQIDDLPSDVSESDIETEDELRIPQSSDSEHSDLEPLAEEDEQEIQFRELCEGESGSGSESDDEIVLDSGAALRRRRQRSPSPAGVILQIQPPSDDDQSDHSDEEPAPKGDPIPQCSEPDFSETLKKVLKQLTAEQKQDEAEWSFSADDKPPKIPAFDRTHVGLKGDIPTTVREMFRAMFSDDIFENLVRHTNNYAQDFLKSSTVTNAKKEHSK